MNITFYNVPNDKNALEKTLNTITGLNPIAFTAKGTINVENPEIILKYNALIYQANYFYIDTLGRYYFMKEPQLIAGGNMIISGGIDVLQTFKTQIKTARFLCTRSETRINEYYNDSNLPIKAYNQRKMYYFPKKPLNGGSTFIMIVGGAT